MTTSTSIPASVLRAGRVAKREEAELPLTSLIEGYLEALTVVVESGFAHEVDWQESRRLENVTEPMFLRETAWVILSSGMRERIIRDRFPAISLAFFDWGSAQAIDQARDQCTEAALRVFRHPAKINAIASVATIVAHSTFAAIHSELAERGVAALEELPFVGPVTKFHLAKNLGLDVAKPDRHLVRLAHAAGASSPERLCRLISEATGDRVATVDLVFWRYATLDGAYTTLFSRVKQPRRCLSSD